MNGTVGHFRDLADWSSTTPRQLVDTHLAKVANTARGYREDLCALAGWLGCTGEGAMSEAAKRLIDSGRAAAKRTLINWINHMRSKNLSASTIRRRVASIKSLIATASDPDIEIIAWQIGGKLPNLPSPGRVRDCKGPDLATVERMLQACRDRFDQKGTRDLAILGLLYWHARRASEVLSIRMCDVDLKTKTVRVIAKRGQGRMTMRLCQRAADAIGRWIDVRGDDDGPLFSRCQHWGRRVMSVPLTYEGLRSVVRGIGLSAGGRCWPHALRHAAISHLAALTDDSSAWGCALSGHKDVRAWAMYQDHTVSHVSAAEILSRGQIVRRDPHSTDN